MSNLPHITNISDASVVVAMKTILAPASGKATI